MTQTLMESPDKLQIFIGILQTCQRISEVSKVISYHKIIMNIYRLEGETKNLSNRGCGNPSPHINTYFFCEGFR